MKPSSRLSWFVETRGVTLSSRDGNVHLSIPYPHAGLWALIANGNYRKDRAVELMSILMSVGKQEAEREIEETISTWIRAGILAEG
jgi:hypothetical protein